MAAVLSFPLLTQVQAGQEVKPEVKAWAFEAASVKPAPPPTGPGIRVSMSTDPGRLNFSNVALRDLIASAYKIKPRQISGPDFIAAERYDVTAKFPEGATRDQVPEMLQKLLAERFGFREHRETKTMAVYAIVTAKNGPKMKATEGEGGGMRISTGAKGRQLKGSTTMGQLADRLSNLLDRPVLDMTGLKGNFEIDLSWSSEGEGVEGRGPMLPPDLAKEAKRLDDAADGADIFTALQEKLGLRLDARKAPVELLIIDNVEKIPTEN